MLEVGKFVLSEEYQGSFAYSIMSNEDCLRKLQANIYRWILRVTPGREQLELKSSWATSMLCDNTTSKLA